MLPNLLQTSTSATAASMKTPHRVASWGLSPLPTKIMEIALPTRAWSGYTNKAHRRGLDDGHRKLSGDIEAMLDVKKDDQNCSTNSTTFEPHPSLDGTKCLCRKGNTSSAPFRHLSRLWAFSLNGVGLQSRSLRSRPLTIEIFYPGITESFPKVTIHFQE